MTDAIKRWQLAALGSYLLLTITIIIWESWGAPSTQSSIYVGLILKTAPLLVLLRGIIRRNIQTHMIATLLMLLYFTEGVVLAYSEFQHGWHIHSEFIYALSETILASLFILSAGMYIRKTGAKRKRRQ